MINPQLLSAPVQAFINDHLRDDTAKLILKGSPFQSVEIKDIVRQIEGKRRIQNKLPTWFKTPYILYPSLLNLSQSSSEITARYKASLISGHELIDITGGFGVDDYYFSRHFNRVIYCELNPSLAEMVKHNFQQLGISKKIRSIEGNSLNYLQSLRGKVDWIYADPDRRSKDQKRMFRLEESQPNIITHLDLLKSKSHGILIKTSPLLDLKYGREQLKTVAEIHLVAVKNEVKEVLWILRPQHQESIMLKTINFDTFETQRFDSQWGQEEQIIPFYGEPQNFLYEPNAAILKAGLFNSFAEKFKLSKLAPNSHLYTSEKPVSLPGRSFRILRTLPFNKSGFKNLKIRKANITIRNFPLSVQEIRKKYSVSDGGNDYLFFTKTEKEKKIMIWCQKTDFRAAKK